MFEFDPAQTEFELPIPHNKQGRTLTVTLTRDGKFIAKRRNQTLEARQLSSIADQLQTIEDLALEGRRRREAAKAVPDLDEGREPELEPEPIEATLISEQRFSSVLRFSNILVRGVSNRKASSRHDKWIKIIDSRGEKTETSASNVYHRLSKEDIAHLEELRQNAKNARTARETARSRSMRDFSYYRKYSKDSLSKIDLHYNIETDVFSAEAPGGEILTANTAVDLKKDMEEAFRRHHYPWAVKDGKICPTAATSGTYNRILFPTFEDAEAYLLATVNVEEAEEAASTWHNQNRMEFD